jgi:hypothetical protein
MTDAEIEQLARQLVQALAGPLLALVKQNSAALIAMIKEQQIRNGQYVTRRQFQQFFMTGNGLYGVKPNRSDTDEGNDQ